ncbi:MAG: hypothetical protein D6731_14500, partial [Planctomycetota bacterium]
MKRVGFVAGLVCAAALSLAVVGARAQEGEPPPAVDEAGAEPADALPPGDDVPGDDMPPADDVPGDELSDDMPPADDVPGD